ncbi:uncharacterized protein [Miscanthus floridulus]|uniref:uncharacterized protein n=1 Tax=Miscanthus floridulus TaxID=154761 RepID=UPI00345A30AB
MQQLHVIEQKDMSIDEYYSAFDLLMGSLISMVPQYTAAENCTALTFIEQFLTYRFVMGVRAEYDSIRNRLLHNSSNITMAQALADLLAEETHLQSMSASSVPHSVVAASQRTGVPKGTSLEPCKYCGRTGHPLENCFVQHPQKLTEYRAHRAARGRGTGSTSRGAVSIAAASPVSASSTSWVLDSGACFHVTSDQSHLVACKSVTDGASIQTADGTSCPSLIRILYNSHFSAPDVSLIPQLNMNLLSVCQITDQNCFVGFDDSSCFI